VRCFFGVRAKHKSDDLTFTADLKPIPEMKTACGHTTIPSEFSENFASALLTGFPTKRIIAANRGAPMPLPSANRSRKAAKLSQSLQRDLSAYALAASAAGVTWLALAPPAEAQIVYTPKHELLTKDGHMSIDLNNDGVVDVTIREIPCTMGTFFYANSLRAIPEPGGGFVWGDGFLKAMSAGSVIGGRDSFYSRPASMYVITVSGVYYGGSWADAGSNPRYLGIRFLIGSETHYGWARITATFEPHNHHIAALLTGYAYETEPNAPIRAGDTGKSDQDAANLASSARPQSNATLGALARGAFRSRGRCGQE
jgi:hypothetical protein